MGKLISTENGDLKKNLIKLASDAFFFIALVIPVAIFNLTNVVQPNVRGFFCSDNSIRYPYRSSTVKSYVLFLFAIPVTIVFTGFIEFVYYKLSRSPRRGIFHPVIVALYRVYGYFIVGATINQVLTDTAKLTVGRLRPMFLDVCVPDVQCNSSIEHQYILDYTCTRTEYPGYTSAELHEMMTDVRKSFPSGHSSFSMYCAVFGVIYLELRMKYKMMRMLKICCQALVMAGAVWVCCTRYLDNKHHATDIATGMLLGSIVGVFAVHLYCRSLTYSDRKRRRSVSVTPSSVRQGSYINSHQMEAEGNGSATVVKVDPDNDAVSAM